MPQTRNVGFHLDPEIHKRAKILAVSAGVPLHRWVERGVKEAVHTQNQVLVELNTTTGMKTSSN
jgi:hypothetical protein